MLSQMARAVGMDPQGAVISVDGVYDCRAHRGMVSNVPGEPARPQQRLAPDIFEARFRAIERVFAWEDKFRRLLLCFERISNVH